MFSSRRRHTRYIGDWSSDVCSSDLKVAVIGAGSRDEFREEDQLCCAWIARDLLAQGFAAANERTTEIVRRWQDAPLSSFLVKIGRASCRERALDEGAAGSSVNQRPE